MLNVKRAEREKEKWVVGNSMDERELETLLRGIPRMASLDHHRRLQNNRQLFMSPSSISSSSFSEGFSSSEDGLSPSMALMNQAIYQPQDTRNLDSRVLKNLNEYTLDDLGLCENLRRMNIGEGQGDFSEVSRLHSEPNGFGFGECSFDLTSPYNFDDYGSFEGFSGNVHGYDRFQPSIPGNFVSPVDYLKANLLGLCQERDDIGNFKGCNLTHDHSNSLYLEPSCYTDRIDYGMGQRDQQPRGSCNEGLQLHNRGLQQHNLSVNRPYLNDELFYSRGSGIDYFGDRRLFNPENSLQMVYPDVAFSVRNPMCNGLMSKYKEEHTRAIPNGRAPPLLPMTDEALSCEDSLITQRRSLKYAVEKGCERSKGRKKKSSSEIETISQLEQRQELRGKSQLKGVSECCISPTSSGPLLSQPTCMSLAQYQGYMYLMAKDQRGCRTLQAIFEEGTHQDVQIIFKEIINHVVELMTNSFGNYLVQKLLGICSEEQRKQIVLMVTDQPGDLVRISLNIHGTRVVQKLIETLKTRQQISLVVQALKPGFLHLIKDLNGYHVIQRCLEFLSKEDNKFIFDGAAKFCVDIATHEQGCCVLNRCIAESVGKYRHKLVAQIAANGLLLAQDPFGNYVVQYIIDLKKQIPSAAASLVSQFEGHYVYLSMQKFSSHVVEKCLRSFVECRPRIIHELLSVPHIEHLLQDPFANYVIQAALQVSKGSLHALLAEAVRSHSFLRSSPYCKKIFSGKLLK